MAMPKRTKRGICNKRGRHIAQACEVVVAGRHGGGWPAWPAPTRSPRWRPRWRARVCWALRRPAAVFSTPWGRGEGWFTLVLSAGAVLRTTWSTAMKLVYCVSRLYCRPRSVMVWRRRAPFQRLLVTQATRCGGAPTGGAGPPCRCPCFTVAAPMSRVWCNRAVGRLAFHAPVALGLAAPFAKHDDRAFGQQVGQVARLHVVHVHAFKAGLTLVNTGESIILRKRAACSAASAGLVMMKGSPMPARARPSIRWRLTLEPMPNENTLAWRGCCAPAQRLRAPPSHNHRSPPPRCATHRPLWARHRRV
jgi:hypothetical protein